MVHIIVARVDTLNWPMMLSFSPADVVRADQAECVAEPANRLLVLRRAGLHARSASRWTDPRRSVHSPAASAAPCRVDRLPHDVDRLCGLVRALSSRSRSVRSGGPACRHPARRWARCRCAGQLRGGLQFVLGGPCRAKPITGSPFSVHGCGGPGRSTRVERRRCPCRPPCRTPSGIPLGIEVRRPEPSVRKIAHLDTRHDQPPAMVRRPSCRPPAGSKVARLSHSRKTG